MQRRWIYAPESYPLDVLAAMALFRGKSGCEVTPDSVLSEREETLEVSIHAPLRLARNTTPSSVACVRICARIRRDNRLAVPIATLNYSRCRLRIWAWRYRNFGGKGGGGGGGGGAKTGPPLWHRSAFTVHRSQN